MEKPEWIFWPTPINCAPYYDLNTDACDGWLYKHERMNST